MNKNKGFTLIEILIVIVIIGITVGFALIAFGDFGETKRFQFAAEQLENTLRLAQQQAIIENSTLGLRINNSSYQILKFHPPASWKPISSKNVFKVHYFPKGLVVTLKTDYKTMNNEPAIIINSSGDINSFTLSFGINKDTAIAVLNSNQYGELNFTTAKTK